jgi:hypothetical protein
MIAKALRRKLLRARISAPITAYNEEIEASAEALRTFEKQPAACTQTCGKITCRLTWITHVMVFTCAVTHRRTPSRHKAEIFTPSCGTALDLTGAIPACFRITCRCVARSSR